VNFTPHVDVLRMFLKLRLRFKRAEQTTFYKTKIFKTFNKFDLRVAQNENVRKFPKDGHRNYFRGIIRNFSF